MGYAMLSLWQHLKTRVLSLHGMSAVGKPDARAPMKPGVLPAGNDVFVFTSIRDSALISPAMSTTAP